MGFGLLEAWRRRGRFTLPLEAGRQLSRVERLGYETIAVEADVAPANLVAYAMSADPVLMDGLTVMVDRLGQRRRAAPAYVPVSVIRSRELATSVSAAGSWRRRSPQPEAGDGDLRPPGRRHPALVARTEGRMTRAAGDSRVMMGTRSDPANPCRSRLHLSRSAGDASMMVPFAWIAAALARPVYDIAPDPVSVANDSVSGSGALSGLLIAAGVVLVGVLVIRRLRAR